MANYSIDILSKNPFSIFLEEIELAFMLLYAACSFWFMIASQLKVGVTLMVIEFTKCYPNLKLT